MMIKRALSLSLLIFSLHGMQKNVSLVIDADKPRAATFLAADIQREQTALSLTLKRQNELIQLELDGALQHLCCYQRIIDSVTFQEKISGLHYYTKQGKKIRNYKAGTVIELNDSLWIYTEQDSDSMHSGYFIYQGRALTDVPKTFFPCAWSKEELINNIKRAAELEKTVWKEENCGAFKILRATIYHEDIPLTLVIKEYSHKRSLMTIYPEIEIKPVKESVLEELAQEQSSVLRTLRHSRFTLMAEQARRKNNDSAAKPELLVAIEDALSTDKDQNDRYNTIMECLKAGANPNVTDDQGKTGLMLAAQHADFILITELLESGASKDSRDRKGKTVLEYALSSCQPYAVLPFLNAAHPQEVNHLSNSGVTPLIYAIDKFSVELVELLLEYGADPSMVDSLGYTPLMHAVKLIHPSEEQLQNALAIIKLLLAKGADIDFQRRDLRADHSKPISREVEPEGAGETALMHAVIYGNERVVKALLDAQADYAISNEKKQTALKIAQNKGFPKVESVLSVFIKEKEDWIREQKADDLIHAVFKNNTRRVRKIIDLIVRNKSSCRINGNGCKNTALFFAVDNNNLDLVIDLLHAGADPRLRCSSECTILEYAQAAHISSDIKRLLQDKVNELNAPKKLAQERTAQRRKMAIEQFKVEVDRDQVTPHTLEIIKDIDPCLIDGKSPLFYAIEKGKTQTVEKLSKLKFCYKDARDLLFLTQTKSEKEILKILLRNGCAQERDLERLVKTALKNERRDVLDLLRMVQNFYFNLIKGSIEKADQELIAAILRFDTNVLTFEQAASCLLLAINRGRRAMAVLLAEQYPLVAASYRDEHEMTPLMHAGHQCMEDLCKKLLEFGADLYAQDAQGRSVIDLTPQKTIEGKKLREFFEKRKKEHKATEKAASTKVDYDVKEFLSKGWTQVMAAAYRDDCALLASYSKEDINKSGPEGVTPLHVAVIHRKHKALGALLQRSDVDVALQDATGSTPLHHAVRLGNEKAVERLLAKDAPVLLCDASGRSVFSVSKSNARTVRIRELLQAALIKKVAKSNSATVHQELRLVLSHLKSEDRTAFYQDLFVADLPIALLEGILKDVAEMRDEISRLVTTYCISCGLTGKADSDQRARAFIEALDQSKAELLVNHNLVEPRLLMYAAIVIEQRPLLYYLCDAYRDMPKPWGLHFVEKAQLAAHLKQLCREPEFMSFEPLIAYKTEVPEISPVIWAWMLKKKGTLKVFFEKKSPELSREILPYHVPAWIFVLCSYHKDAELGKLLREWMNTHEVQRLLSDGEAVGHLARENFWPALRLLLEEKKINGNLPDSNGNTLIMNALQGYRRVHCASRTELDKMEPVLLTFIKDLVERFHVDCNQVNNQGAGPYEVVVRSYNYPLIVYFLCSSCCKCLSRVSLPQNFYRYLIQNESVPRLCALISTRPALLEPIAIAAVQEKNTTILAIALTRLTERSLDNVVSCACNEGDERVVKLLIEKGKLHSNKIYRSVPSETSAECVTGTPLMIALQRGNEPLFVQLLKIQDTNLSVEHPETHLTVSAMAQGNGRLCAVLEAFKQSKDIEGAYIAHILLSLFSRSFNQAAAELSALPNGVAENVRAALIDYVRPLAVRHIALPEALTLNCPTKGYPVKAIAMSGSVVAFCLSNGLIGCWYGHGDKKIDYRLVQDPVKPRTVTSFEISPNGKYLVAGFENGQLITVDLENWLTFSAQVVEEPIIALAFNDENEMSFLFVTKSGHIKQSQIVGTPQKAVTNQLAQCPEPILQVRPVGNKGLLAVMQDGITLKSLSLDSDDCQILKFTKPINAMVQSNDPNTVFVISGNQLLAGHLSDKTALCLQEENNEPITNIARSKDGEWMLSSTTRALMLFWNLRHVKERRFSQMNFGHHPIEPIRCVALSENGTYAAVGCDNGVVRMITLRMIDKVNDTLQILFAGRCLIDGPKLLENEFARRVMDHLPKRLKDGLLKFCNINES